MFIKNSELQLIIIIYINYILFHIDIVYREFITANENNYSDIVKNNVGNL